VHADGLDRATRRLALRTLAALSIVGVVTVVVAGSLVGAPGALGAAIGVGLALVLFGGSAGLLALVAHRRPTAAVGVLVGGALARLALYAVVLAAVSRAPGVDTTSLAVSTGVAVAVALADELRTLSRLPSLYWVDADAAPARLVPSATRS
jgi:membrane-associated PAP2 superfamily phosphatase